MATPITKTTNATTAGNVQIFDANGFPIYEVGAVRWAAKSTDASIFYVGEASTGALANVAAWRISEINTTTGSIKWAAAGSETSIWDNREALSYA